MQKIQTAVVANEYRNVAVASLVESPTNPRKRFDEISLQELAASIKSQGLLEPLLVREREQEKNRYEVVVGARRLRAAKLAGIGQVPVRVVSLTDAQTIEAQVVENLQREDIHPLEEAMGFRSLLELKDPKYTMASIAARAGKGEAYVLGRIKLTELIPPVAEAFLRDKIAVGHALLIAKLPASQQQEALAACFHNQWTSEGNTPVLVPVRELAAWIESNILLQLASVPFDKQDEALLPKAGSCVNCPKRTGFNKLLFADVRKDSCTDPQCFQAKIDAHVKKTIESQPKLVQISSSWSSSSREGAPLGRNRYVELDLKKTVNGRTKASYQKICDKTVDAIVVDGGRRGQTVKICSDLACRVHHPNQPSPEQIERERTEERKRIERDKLAITVRHRILAAILERVSAPLKKADLLVVTEALIEYLPHNQALLLGKRHRIESKQESDSVQEQLAKQASRWDEATLCRFLLEASLFHGAYHLPQKDESDELTTTATRYRVDTAKLQKTVAAEFAAKHERKQRAKQKLNQR